MGLATTKYLDTKEIDLAHLKAVVKSQVFAKLGNMPLLDDNKNEIGRYEGPILFRELVNTLGKRVGFERILDEKVSLYQGSKPNNKYLTGGSSSHGYTPIGFDPTDLPNMSGTLVVLAGLADGYRINQATNLPVACGVGEANIPKIVAELKTAISVFNIDLKLIASADDDKAGLRACVKSGVDWVVPETDNDWSDVYQNRGSYAVSKQFANVRDFVPIYLVDQTLEQMGLTLKNPAAGTRADKPNQFLIQEAEGAFAGVQIGIRVRDPKAIESLDQYIDLAKRIGCYRQHNGYAAFLSSSMSGHALLMSLLHDGLMVSLGDQDKRYAAAFSKKMLLSAHGGMLEQAEALEENPIVLNAYRDPNRGLIVSISSAYDKSLVRLITSVKVCKPEWVKEKKRWELAINQPEMLALVLNELGSALEGRLAVVPANSDRSFIAYSRGRHMEVMALFKEDLEWLSIVQEDIARAPVHNGSTAEITSVSLCLHDGWKMMALKLPKSIQASHQAQLRALNAIYDDGVWRMPLSQAAIDLVVGLNPRWEGCDHEGVMESYRRNGFGLVSFIGNDRVIVKSPYSAELVNSIKTELPKMARRYDSELMCWEIHIASGAIGSVVQEIIRAHDLRVMSPKGEVLPAGIGHEMITPRQARQGVSGSGKCDQEEAIACISDLARNREAPAFGR